MALDKTVPAAGQTLASSRDPIRNNFISINDQFELDHYAFNSTNNGLHKKVTLPDQAAAPGAVATGGILYGALSATSASTELHYVRSVGNTYPVTMQDYEMTTSSFLDSGWARLPSGLVIKWQKSNGPASGNASITINTNTIGPAGTILLTVQVTPRSNHSFYISNINAEEFTVTASATTGARSFTWFSIGY